MSRERPDDRPGSDRPPPCPHERAGATDRAPLELVIAWMQPQREHTLPDLPFPVRHVFVSATLCRSRLRGTGRRMRRPASISSFSTSTAIPSPTTVEAYGSALAQRDGVMLGEVLYLPGRLPS